MRRVRFYSYGGPEVLTVEEADVPEPGPGQVRIRATAIGANFVDTKFRRGAGSIFQRPLPGKLTGDAVGYVDAVGSDVDGALAGRRVAALVDEDAFADYALAGADWLAPVPDDLDDAAASMLSSAAPVALGTLRVGRLAAGETVLVQAAAGTIGHLAVQLAKLLGAGTVIATAGSAAKLDFARSLGADGAVDYTDEAWPARLRELAPGVDVVLDAVGGRMTRQSVELLAPFGRLVAYGAAAGELAEVPVRSLYALRSVTGFSLRARQAASPERARADVAELTDHFRAGRLHPTVHTRLPLDKAAEAHRLLDARAHLGRVLLVP